MARSGLVRLVVAGAVAGFSAGAMADTYFLANLDGAQEVPPVASAATGMGRVILNEARNSVRVSLDFSGLGSNQTAAHIHGPALPGVNGPVIINIGSSGAAAGTFNVSAAVTAAQVADLEAGRWYFNVHSTTFPAGEIRGQVLADKPFDAVLTGAQEVPANVATGLGRGTVSVNAAGTRIAVDLQFAGLSGNATMAHVHGLAAPGANAGVLFNLPPPAATAATIGDLFFNIAPVQLAGLQAGQMYFNVHTGAFPGGEIRGQLYATPRASAFLAPLRGSEEVPPSGSAATGLGVIDLLPGETRMRVSVYWDGVATGVTMGHIHGPAPVGVNAGVLFNLNAAGGASGQAPTFTTAITPAQLADLRQGRWYFNLHSPAFPGGEIRGQVFPAWPFRTVMSGSQETPANASTALGLGQVLLAPAADQILAAFDFAGLSANATMAHLHQAAIGVAGPVVFNTPPPAASAGSVDPLRFAATAPQVQALRDRQLYYNVHNGPFPAGEIRGQLAAHDVVFAGAFD